MKKIILFILALSLINVSYAKDVIEITASHSPGGPSDSISRTINLLLPKNEYIVVNRPGAGSQVGTRYAIQNHTLLTTLFMVTYVSNTNMPTSLKNLVEEELEIIATVGIIPFIVICNKKTNINNIEDLINYNKILNFGDAGPTSVARLATKVLFKTIQKEHSFIPYQTGQGKIISDLLGGHIDCAVAMRPGLDNALNSNNINVLVSTHNVPGYKFPLWKEIFKSEFPFENTIGFTISKHINPEIKNKIKKDLIEALNNNEAEEKINKAGFIFYPKTKETDINNEINKINDVKKYFSN